MVYIDPLFDWPAEAVQNAQARRLTAKHGQWCHMMADSQEELLAFALKLGMKAVWIQQKGTPREHFDLTPSRRAAAVKRGAKEITAREMVDIGRRIAYPKSEPMDLPMGETPTNQWDGGI